jgi:hypothetical protein
VTLRGLQQKTAGAQSLEGFFEQDSEKDMWYGQTWIWPENQARCFKTYIGFQRFEMTWISNSSPGLPIH